MIQFSFYAVMATVNEPFIYPSIYLSIYHMNKYLSQRHNHCDQTGFEPIVIELQNLNTVHWTDQQ